MWDLKVRINWRPFFPPLTPTYPHPKVYSPQTNASSFLSPASPFTSCHPDSSSGIPPTCSSQSSSDLHRLIRHPTIFLSLINHPRQCQNLEVSLPPKREKRFSPPYQLSVLSLTSPLLDSWPGRVTSPQLPIFTWSSHVLIFAQASGLFWITLHFPFQISISLWQGSTSVSRNLFGLFQIITFSF